MKEKFTQLWNNLKKQSKELLQKTIKTIRWYAAFSLRLIGYIMSIPTVFFYAVSNMVKNNEDDFIF